MRNYQLLTAIAIAIASTINAQITTDPSGNIGIKNASPETPLHVTGESRFNGPGWFSRTNNGTLAPALNFGQNNAWDKAAVTISTEDANGWNYAYWTSSRAGHTFRLFRQSTIGEKEIAQMGGGDGGHNFLLYDATDGHTTKVQLNSNSGSYISEGLGIGTNAPASKLHVHTTADYDGIRITHSAGGIVRLQANSLQDFAWNGITKQGDAGLIFGDAGGQNLVNFGFVIAPWRGGTSGLRIDQSGSVSIGTRAVDANSKLLVEGTVRARKVRVDQATWPDYVFERGYTLPSLAEVEEFIRQNKHLPDVPSANEVKQEGIDLGNNQAVLLRKIEELTLYVIRQQKQIEELQKEMKQRKK